MKESRYLEIKAFVLKNDKITDGDEFLAAMEADGVSSRELKEFANETKKRERLARDARRGLR